MFTAWLDLLQGPEPWKAESLARLHLWRCWGVWVMYCIVLDHHSLPFTSFELWLGISGHPRLRPLVVIYEHLIVAVRSGNASR
jgi:hypothetical protein